MVAITDAQSSDRPGPVPEQGAHALDRDAGAVVGGQGRGV